MVRHNVVGQSLFGGNDGGDGEHKVRELFLPSLHLLRIETDSQGFVSGREGESCQQRSLLVLPRLESGSQWDVPPFSEICWVTLTIITQILCFVNIKYRKIKSTNYCLIVENIV